MTRHETRRRSYLPTDFAFTYLADPDVGHVYPPVAACTVENDLRIARADRSEGVLPLHFGRTGVELKIATLLKPFASSIAGHPELGPGELTEYGALRSEESTVLTRGVRQHGHTMATYYVPEWYERPEFRCFKAMHALHLVRPDLAATGITAALLLGIPLPRRYENSRIHVASAPDSVHVQRDDILHTRTKSYFPLDFFGVPVNQTPFVLASLSRLLPHRDLVAACDFVCGPWRSTAFATVDQFRAHFRQTSGFPGKRSLLAALEDSRDGVGSNWETYYRLAMIRGGLPEPRVAPEVVIPGLPKPIHPDLAWVEVKVAFEYDGEHHDYDRDQNHYDKKTRYPAMWEAGWKVVIATREDRMADKIAEVAKALRSRGAL